MESFLQKHYVRKKKSMQTVARELGCDCALVDYYMRKYQIPRRSISEARRLQSNHFRDVEIKEAKGDFT